MAKKVLPAREILAQARDTIASTYWIQGEEADIWENEEDFNWFLARNSDHQPSKFVEVLVGPREKAKVTGVCSIGAMSLAHATLRNTRFVSFDELWTRDFQTRLAAEALAATIREVTGEYTDHDTVSTITSWNDSNGRTSKEVVQVFDKALESPILNAKAIWEIRTDHWRLETSALSFTTKKDADDFAKKINKALDKAVKDGLSSLAYDNERAAELVYRGYRDSMQQVPNAATADLKVQRVTFS